MSTDIISLTTAIECIPTVLSNIPDTVWAAVTAALITLFGVHLSNRNSREQLRIQIDRQEQENRRHRKAEMRRSVYLQLCEVLPRINILYLSLGDAVIDIRASREVMTDLGSVASKIQLIGESETSKLAIKLSNEYAQFWTDALHKSLDVQNALRKEEREGKYANDLHGYLQTKLKELDSADSVDYEKTKAYVASLSEAHNEAQQNFQTARTTRMELRKEYIKWAVQRLEVPQDIAIALSAELRTELETSTDKDQLIQIMKTSRDEVRNRIVEMM
ncbi:hypothetical protein [Marinobacter qingdaonensis]|uniref:Uncharacterized protein n=1 Tax=Marinobacter qingdaonensis TaxID=3108486 RepID=A0ABU5NYF7_9GAMM|nr:hypothetical protein [Marinobacter sp. ASW11-75]MEA1080772.1 hypothetical protein [Marinobacter sp. ASW11-75]